MCSTCTHALYSFVFPCVFISTVCLGFVFVLCALSYTYVYSFMCVSPSFQHGFFACLSHLVQKNERKQGTGTAHESRASNVRFISKIVRCNGYVTEHTSFTHRAPIEHRPHMNRTFDATPVLPVPLEAHVLCAFSPVFLNTI